MKIGMFGFAVLFVTALSAQKVTEKVLNADGLKVVALNTENVFELTVSTAKVSEAMVTASFEGEFTNDLFITTEEHTGHLNIGIDFSPLFVKNDDKLAAHKHISVSMSVVLPENVELIINGTSTLTHISGVYSNLQLYIYDGDCHINGVKGPGNLVTFSGNIFADAYSGNVNATSDYGKVVVNPAVQNSFLLSIHSVKGNISVNTNK